MTMSLTALRKSPEGTTVGLIKAPWVRFKRVGKEWHEVPRPGIAPRVSSSSDIHLLGVDLVS